MPLDPTTTTTLTYRTTTTPTTPTTTPEELAYISHPPFLMEANVW
jgi:hypothetical protein